MRLIRFIIVAALLQTALVATSEPWRSYEVYRPRIERHAVVDAYAQELKYNHDSTLAWFRDRWFCLWNAHQKPVEGTPGQLNYMSTSPDGRTWSPAEPAFASERHSVNPIPCPKGTQWQPCLIVVGDELWAVWSQSSGDEFNGCYVSRLSAPDGKWMNRRLEWEGRPDPEVDGKRWRIFPTQNPVRLRSGRVLAPVTMIGPPAADAPPAVKSWWATEKRDSVIYSDDGGKTWLVSPGAMQPGRTWAQWEPTVWERPDGTVMMFARNNDFRERREGGPRPAEMLLWSKSTDGGATWTPHEYAPLETVASRMHVLPAGGDRYMMAHNDWPADHFASDRWNLALFFTRGAGFDFVAGPGFTDYDPVVCYPHMAIRDNSVLISFSQGMVYSSIDVARISPLPDPNRYYLFPRTNMPPSPRPERVGNACRFSGGQYVATRQAVDPGAECFSIGAWVRAKRGGAILDTRSARPAGGFVVGLSGGGEEGFAPFIYLGTPERNIMPATRIKIGQWDYLGITVDRGRRTVTFFINGRAETIAFTGSPAPFRGDTGHIGAKRLERSQITGLTADVRALAVFGSERFGVEQHNGLRNAFAETLGCAKCEPSAAPGGKPALWFDPADVAAFERDFALPIEEAGGVHAATADGCPALCFRGEASAGVDLDANERARGDRVLLAFRFRIESGEEHVLCTAGDANEPARLVERGGEVFLQSKDQRMPCGRANPAAWNTVELASGGEETSVKLNGGPQAAVKHRPVATWLYLGQGYRAGNIPAASRFFIDIASVRSKVERAGK